MLNLLYIVGPTAKNQNQTHFQTLALIFGVLNGVLIIVIIGELFSRTTIVALSVKAGGVKHEFTLILKDY